MKKIVITGTCESLGYSEWILVEKGWRRISFEVVDRASELIQVVLVKGDCDE